MSKEIPGKIDEHQDDEYIFKVANSAEDLSDCRIITKKQYEAELREAYFAGWEDRNDCELREIIHKRKATKEDYFKWFMEELKKKRDNVQVIFEDDDGNQD